MGDAGQGAKNWGDNNVSGTLDGGTGNGQLLKLTFSRNGLTNEGRCRAAIRAAACSSTTAGNGSWRDQLSRRWSVQPESDRPDIPASLFDKGGLYVAGKQDHRHDGGCAGNWYATRISSRQSWIKSIINLIRLHGRDRDDKRRHGRGSRAGGRRAAGDGDIAPASSPRSRRGGRE